MRAGHLQIKHRFQLRKTMRAFAMDNRGATAIEYAIIAGLVSIVILGAVTLLGQSTLNLFTTTADAIQ